MNSLESRIIDYQKMLYDTTNPNAIQYSLFDDNIENDNVDLPYGDELIDVKIEEISDTYFDALDDYIKADIVIPGIYALHVMGKIKKRK